MHIAMFSFEYPPDTGYGGIATTTQQIARMMTQRGHSVEVFAGSQSRTQSRLEEGFWVHRVVARRRIDFIQAVLPIFRERHQAVSFDVIESPEFGADAAAVVKDFPNIPLAVRLHTPSAMVAEHDGQGGWQAKLRVKLGALRRGINPFGDLERRLALSADELIAPSWAIGKELIRRWHLDPRYIHHVPNPFIPSPTLLKVQNNNQGNVVTFIGRLDIKKGVTDLATAIPSILETHPQAKFRFVGRNGASPKAGQDMKVYLETVLRTYLDSVEFTGQVSQSDLPSVLASSDICIFPSRWENFPNVCLEAMSAARAVIGSSAGGMAEIIHSDKYGRLVPPKDKDAIAATVIELLQNPDLRMQLGHNARRRVLSTYSAKHIGKLQEESYFRAIDYRQRQKPRSSRFLL